MEVKQSPVQVLNPTPISSYRAQDQDTVVLNPTPISSIKIQDLTDNVLTNASEVNMAFLKTKIQWYNN